MRSSIAALLVGELVLLGSIATIFWQAAGVLAGAQLIALGLFRGGKA